jgi:hypothetical protein
VSARTWSTLAQLVFPKTKQAANQAADGFDSVSDQWCTFNYITAVDGYLFHLQTPYKKDAKNVKSFFSGYYQCHGVNVQVHAIIIVAFCSLLLQALESWVTWNHSQGGLRVDFAHNNGYPWLCL